MDEKNPLLYALSTGSKTNNCNARGRPPISKIIKFSPQPKSIISQYLNNKSDKKNVIKYQNNKSADSKEFSNDYEQYQNDVCLETNLIKDHYSNHISLDLKDKRLNKITVINQGQFESGSKDRDSGFLKKKYLPSEHDKRRKVIHQRDSKPCTEEKVKEVTCPVCSHRCDNTKDLKKHLSTHKNTKKYSCSYPDCSYTCKQSSNLIKHKRIHTAEKPYLCDQCTFRSNFVNSLKVHKRIHTAERPYKCKHCGYQCNSSSNLKKHCLHRHPVAAIC